MKSYLGFRRRGRCKRLDTSNNRRLRAGERSSTVGSAVVLLSSTGMSGHWPCFAGRLPIMRALFASGAKPTLGHPSETLFHHPASGLVIEGREPRRVLRRQFGLSHAAMSGCSSIA